jgi:hypothetical protein
MKTFGIAIAWGVAGVLGAAVEGVVHNGTTGKPAPGVGVVLMKLDQGMVPVGSTKTDAAGKFRFETSVEGAHGLLRAQFEGVTYTEIVTPGAGAQNIQLHVYSAAKEPFPPESRVMLLEPSGSEMVVNESYLFRNDRQPPATYVGGPEGTLRFHVPPGARGAVQVHVSGVGGVPLRLNPERAGEANVFKVDHPIKPGENRIDLTYRVPYQSPLELAVRTLYPNVTTRIAAPQGVSIEAAGLQQMGQEPQTKASIFSIAAAEFQLKIAGEGSLPRGREAGGEGGGGAVSIMPAAVHQQRWIIFGFAAAILALGFYGLYTASGAPAPPAQKAAKKRKS